MPDQVPEEVKRERIERLVEVVQRIARRAERASGSAGSRRCSSRARAAPTRRSCAGRTRRNTTVNFAGAAEPGELVPVRIEGATSTTLRGRRPRSSPPDRSHAPARTRAISRLG